MLSFGIEYERAFSIAFCSARFAAGSGPPSRAATMIARASFENSLPRLASAAPFLCLIDDHLLCPDKLCLLGAWVRTTTLAVSDADGARAKPALLMAGTASGALGEFE